MPGLTLARAQAWPASVARMQRREQVDLVGVLAAAHARPGCWMTVAA